MLSLRLSTTFSLKNLRPAAATSAAWALLSGALPVSVSVTATGSL